MASNQTNAASAMNVRAVARAAAILKTFVGKPLQSLAEITDSAGLDKGTTRRILVTLINSGFVVQDPVTQRYGLGRVIRMLSAHVQEHFGLRSVAVPVLDEIAQQLHTTTFLSVYQDRSALCLDRVHDMKGMEVHWWAVGGTLPFNSGGAPKLLLAYQSPEEIDAVLREQPLRAVNDRVVTDEAVFRQNLAEIRARGWVFAVDDVTPGLAALAVPVLDHAGGIICSLSMAGLTPQMAQDGKPVHLELMLKAAERVRAMLGVADRPERDDAP